MDERKIIKRQYFVSYVVRNNGETRLFGQAPFITKSWFKKDVFSMRINRLIISDMIQDGAYIDDDVVIITALNRV